MRVVREWQRRWQQQIRPRYRSALREPGFRDSIDDVEGAAEDASSALSRLVIALGADLEEWVVVIERWHRGQTGKLFTPTGVRLDTLLSPK